MRPCRLFASLIIATNLVSSPAAIGGESITPSTEALAILNAEISFDPLEEAGLFTVPDFERRYRAIAEFEPVQGLIISWPKASTPEYDYDEYARVLSSIVKEARSEATVYIDLHRSTDFNRVVEALAHVGLSRDDILQDPYIVIENFGAGGSLWVRDYGPFYVEKEGTVTTLDFVYSQFQREEAADGFPLSLHLHEGAPLHGAYEAIPMVFDGGNFIHNGNGLILIPDDVFARNVDRGPYTHSEVWLAALEMFGTLAVRVRQGPGQHADMGMKFLDEDTILIAELAESASPDLGTRQRFEELEENVAILQRIQNWGRELEIVRVPVELDHFSAPVPYTNSLILNRKVLVPISRVSTDDEALRIYERHLPGHEVVGIDYSEINGWVSGGAVHCLTREIPAQRPRYTPRPAWPSGRLPHTKTLELRWERVEGSDRYRIEIDKDKPGNRVLTKDVKDGEKPLTLSWKGDPSSTYYWRVAAIKGKKVRWSERVPFAVSSK